MEERNIYWMNVAISYAKKAYEMGEVPVGAVIVHRDKIVGYGYNTREHSKNALDHAEIKAIDMACKALGGWRLVDCSLYVTLEPCSMCAGACINARIERIYYGAPDVKYGGFGGVVNLNDYPFNFHPQVFGGIQREQIQDMMRSFFVQLRAKKAAEKKKREQG